MKPLLLSLAMLSAISMYAESPIHVTPAPGEVTELSEFLFTFDGEWALGVNRTGKFTVTGPEGIDIPKMNSYSLGAAGGYMAYFVDDIVISTPGTYILTVPANKFEVAGVPLEEMTFEYVIVGEVDPNAYTGQVRINPKSGVYDTIDMWTLTFDGAVSIVDEEAILLTDNDGTDVRLHSETDGTTLTIYPLTDTHMLSEPGRYTLEISAGTLTVDGKTVKRLSYDYEITGAVATIEYTMTPEPGSYMTIDHGFELTFITDEEVRIAKNSVWMKGPNGDIEVNATLEGETLTIMPVDESGNAIPLAQKGVYTIIITMGTVHVGDWTNEEPFVFDYELSGVTNIESLTTGTLPTDAYSISGLHYGTTANLPAGIYIINGKKVKNP